MKYKKHIKQSIAMENQQKKEHFLTVVSNAGWKLLTKGNTPDLGGATGITVIGVAVWDNLSMEALGKLAAKSYSKSMIYVFDFDDCLTVQEMGNYAPGIQGVQKEPIVAEYINGKLSQILEGSAAVDWMLKMVK
jgi:hypothetical protein